MPSPTLVDTLTADDRLGSAADPSAFAQLAQVKRNELWVQGLTKDLAAPS